MANAKLFNMAGQQVGEIELSEAIFGIEPNQAVVHEVVKNHLANCRQGTQSALTRAEVSGGGKKPWRQKGTGHARQGSTRAPQWTHGGGPVHRHAGSMGPIDPAHIFKGKIGAGQMGNEQVTVQNLDIVMIDEELNLIAVRGAIPGPKGGVVFVKNTVKVHKVKQAGAGISNNPQKASARVNPQKASARNK